MEIINTFVEGISHHNNYNQISFRFFTSFSRFEYALKRAGFIYTPRGETFAHASLNDYATSIEQTVNLDDKSIKGPVDYIVRNPPNVLHFANEELHWIPLTPQSRSIRFILDCMRTTRNNLFHGNKQLPGNNLRRNSQLISSFLPIIDYLISQNEEVRDHFLSDLEG